MQRFETPTAQAPESEQLDSGEQAHSDLDAHEEHEHGEIHMPPPSIRPIIMALGVTLFAAGLITTIWLLLAGLAIFLFGIGGWIYDDIKHDKAEQRRLEQQSDHGS